MFQLHKKRTFAITGNSQYTILAEVRKNHAGQPVLNPLAQTDDSLLSDVTMPRLLTEAGNIHGKVAIALPLTFFEVVAVNLPQMPDGAVAKALPYHLSKAISKPLNEYIYDWQITTRHRDRLQVTVYLFPAESFHKLRGTLSRQQLDITSLEADVFAAFAYLERTKRLNEGEATLCALIWPQSISFAVYDNRYLTLVRTLDTEQPDLGALHTEEEEEQVIEESTKEEDDLLISYADSEESNALLADFQILTSEPGSEKESMVQSETGDKPQQELSAPKNWSSYLELINLEIMRTRDYYASVQKGASIKRAFIGGAENFWQELVASSAEVTDLEFEQLCDDSTLAKDSEAIFQAMGTGTGARW